MQVHSQKVSMRLNHEPREKLFDTLDTKGFQVVPLFVHSLQQTLRDFRKPIFQNVGSVRISKYN